MEYRFPSGAISFMYNLIQNKSVMFDEITLRIFSRLAYFRERPYPYYNESEFNELNIYSPSLAAKTKSDVGKPAAQ